MNMPSSVPFFQLDFYEPLPIQIEVSDAPLTSDAGLLPLRQFDERIGLTKQFAAALDDPRDPELTEHTFLVLPWQPIDASQDWHPARSLQFPRPPRSSVSAPLRHGYSRAEFLPGLHTSRFHAIWRKGFQRDFEVYALTAQHPSFSALLAAEQVQTVVVYGIATNICCLFVARDLRQAGLRVLLVENASAGIFLPHPLPIY